MRSLKILGLSMLTLASFGAGSAPAFARPHDHHRHQVCRMEHHHGHPQRVCHWSR